MATAPISDQDTRNDYSASAGQATFPYTFWIKEEDHLDVYVNGALKTLTTDYTVSATQSVTGANVVFGTGLSDSDKVAIVYNPDIERQTEFQTSGTFTADALNLELSYLTSLLQYLDTQADRTIRLTDSSAGTAATISASLTNGEFLTVTAGEIASSGVTSTTIADASANATAAADSATAAASSATAAAASATEAADAALNADVGDINALTSATPTLTDEVPWADKDDNNNAKKSTWGDVLGLTSQGLVPLAEVTATDVAAMEFTSLIDGTFDEYIFKFHSVVPAVDGGILYLRTSTDGGSNYDDGSADYGYNNLQNDLSANSSGGIAIGTGANVMSLFPPSGNATGEKLIATLHMFDASKTEYTYLKALSAAIKSDGNLRNNFSTGVRLAASAVNAIRFYMHNGNISGTIRMYGVTKS